MSVNYQVHNNNIILYNTILQCHIIMIENDELELASRGRQSDLQCHFVCAGEDFTESSMPRYVCVCMCVCVCTVCVCVHVCVYVCLCVRQLHVQRTISNVITYSYYALWITPHLNFFYVK